MQTIKQHLTLNEVRKGPNYEEIFCLNMLNGSFVTEVQEYFEDFFWHISHVDFFPFRIHGKKDFEVFRMGSQNVSSARMFRIVV